MRSLADVNTIVDNLQARVNQLDGTGLADPTESTRAVLQAEVEGLRETVNQAVLTLDAHLTELETKIAALETLLRQHLGL